ncbi:uncharacterized protein LOC143489390 isoform X1 [Brachyhypopomus gauderio]|uniref:uncharacterized protein LOC143489390 isoform X1 n=1 Tax=Brachyhypopomus gauderio TaxID=698409 RepID=UPI0040431D64
MFGQPRVQRESERIKKQRDISDRLDDLESLSDISFKNNLQKAAFEAATQTGSAKTMIRHELARQREAVLGHTALTLVRREALRKTLEQDTRLYDVELNQRGLAIYQQRI